MDAEKGPRRRRGLTGALFTTPERHPTLNDVLNRRTRAPIDLFSFYIYMRDQQRSVDYLDFWLDVSQHMTLCRHYVRDLRRSVLADTPEGASKRSSGNTAGGMDVAEAYDSAAGPSEKRSASDNRISQVLRDNRSQHSKSNSQNSNNTSAPSVPRRPSHSPSARSGRSARSLRSARSARHLSSSSATPGTGHERSGSSSTPQTNVNRADVRASAERILYTYLLPGAEREIILPQSIVNEITEEIEQNGRDDPEVFDAAKDYVFQAMDRDAFPGFLQSKALGNLVSGSLMLRLILGLLGLFAAFWAGFILIFLDKSSSTRCWLILPFTIGTYTLNSYEWMLDPLLAFIGLSEYTFMSFTRIHEPYVRQLLLKRAAIAFLTFLIIDVALCVLFILVPGKRL
ncbi:regulator of G protein signaling superfamily [Microthyrium microscopicum]|uniref:Regulator of G protein signaling superfamily n=1 Tax=Microthyrium microscopicum TaxID=703497 RepID=A0A6A6TVQ8_9PEZI|nr:regulator of G protein signaling superfamily [Microthyrium microscopicum]